MRIDNIKIPASSVMRDIKLNVCITGLTAFRVRIWIGTKLIVLAATIIGCSIEISMPERSDL